ncbi:hypothetical protein CSKR_113611 [Clonorchis sinensis]|uniref:Uncharacterized protein n=1 Tax=Clonorchis sinensis TaxID=79923 RepID=A0A8T1M880_CLOSI|nr:hypothetical protein CSKR_113611 [Clonorchis sinensis]
MQVDLRSRMSYRCQRSIKFFLQRGQLSRDHLFLLRGFCGLPRLPNHWYTVGNVWHNETFQAVYAGRNQIPLRYSGYRMDPLAPRSQSGGQLFGWSVKFNGVDQSPDTAYAAMESQRFTTSFAR